jgi:hypothetical protein
VAPLAKGDGALVVAGDRRTYDLGTAYGHIAIGVDDLDGTLERLAEQGIEPERESLTGCARAVRDCASSATRTVTLEG